MVILDRIQLIFFFWEGTRVIGPSLSLVFTAGLRRELLWFRATKPWASGEKDSRDFKIVKGQNVDDET